MTTSTTTTSSTLHPDEADALCYSYVEEFTLGLIDETETRRRIAGAIFATDVHRKVAREWGHKIPHPFVDDLTDRLSELITRKVLTPGPRNFQLDAAINHSACGWARNLCRAAARSEVRNIFRERDRNHEYGTDDMGLIEDCLAGEHVEPVAPEATRAEALREFFEDAVKGCRGNEALDVAAFTFGQFVGIPKALRPARFTDRDFCKRAIEADEMLAGRSLRAFHNLVTASVADPADVEVDDRLLALWDDFTAEQADLVLSHGAKAAHMLAFAAVADWPKPAMPVMANMRQHAGRGHDRAWRTLASALVDAWVATQCEPLSRYHTCGAIEARRQRDGHTLSRNRFDELANRAAAHPDAPLGRTPDQVGDRLYALYRLAKKQGTASTTAAA